MMRGWLWQVFHVGVVAIFLCGCSSRSYTGPRRIPLSGKVLADGQPIGMGVISFVPEDKTGRVSGGPIKEGTYAVPEEAGAYAGKYRVEIYWNKPTGKKIRNPMDKEEMIDEMMQGLPERYNAKSELTADVSTKNAKFDFDLKTK